MFVCEGVDGEETARAGSQAEENRRDAAEETGNNAAKTRGTEKVINSSEHFTLMTFSPCTLRQ